MQVIFNSNINYQPTNTSFQAKKFNAVKTALRNFDKKVANPRSQLKDPTTLRFILEKLLKGIKPEILAESFGICLSKINKLSAEYNAHKIYMQNRDDIILKRLLSNENREKIAKEMDINIRTVQSVADKHKTCNTNKLNRDNFIKKKFLSGQTIRKIAETLNIAPVTVRRSLKNMGLL